MMHMRKLLPAVGLFILFAIVLMPGRSLAQAAFTQDPAAAEVLDALARKYKSYTSYKANFTRSIEGPTGKNTGKTTGDILVEGEKFNLKLAEQEMFCDGKTIWTYIKSANEVMVNEHEPGADEIYPGTIFTLYQNGYKYILMGEIKDGKEVLQIIDLEPADRQKPVMKVRMIVRKNDKSVKKWTVFERGTNIKYHFTLNNFVPNAPVTAQHFSFDKSKYPNVKVVDLR